METTVAMAQDMLGEKERLLKPIDDAAFVFDQVAYMLEKHAQRLRGFDFDSLREQVYHDHYYHTRIPQAHEIVAQVIRELENNNF